MFISTSSMNNTWHKLEAETFHPKAVLEDISLVIPTLGRSILSECLYWIAAADYWPAELWIIDQGSKEEVNSWVQALQKSGLNARCVTSQKHGRAAGINCGFDQVKTCFVAVTDDDCFVSTDWLYNMAIALRENPDKIITGRVDAAGDSELDFCVVTSMNPEIYTHPQLKVHPLIGGNMGVSMENVRQIGSFDEHPSIHSAEDSDWGYRALRMGIPIIYNPGIVLRHYGWRNAAQRTERYVDYARSQGAFYGKYLLSGDLLIPIQAMRSLIRAPIRWIRGLIHRDEDMVARGRADTLQLLPGILSGARREQP